MEFWEVFKNGWNFLFIKRFKKNLGYSQNFTVYGISPYMLLLCEWSAQSVSGGVSLCTPCAGTSNFRSIWLSPKIILRYANNSEYWKKKHKYCVCHRNKSHNMNRADMQKRNMNKNLCCVSANSLFFDAPMRLPFQIRIIILGHVQFSIVRLPQFNRLCIRDMFRTRIERMNRGWCHECDIYQFNSILPLDCRLAYQLSWKILLYNIIYVKAYNLILPEKCFERHDDFYGRFYIIKSMPMISSSYRNNLWWFCTHGKKGTMDDDTPNMW